MLNDEEYKKMVIGNQSKITIERTGQLEYKAVGYGMYSTGSSEEEAELDLLRKVVLQLKGVIESLK